MFILVVSDLSMPVKPIKTVALRMVRNKDVLGRSDG